MKTLITFVLASSLLCACEREGATPPSASPPEGPAQTEEAAMREAVQEAAPANAAAAAAPHPSIANLTDAQWCEVAHSDTVKLVEGIRASMKRAGKDDPTYAPPARDEYIAACGKLPLAMQKCLVLAYSMQNRDECQATQDALNPEEQVVYKDLMGK